MHQHNCPVCGATLDCHRLTWSEFVCIRVPFRCQTCATMLHWELGRYHWPLMLIFSAMIPLVVYAWFDFPKTDRWPVVSAICIVLMLPAYWILLFAPKILVKHSNE